MLTTQSNPHGLWLLNGVVLHEVAQNGVIVRSSISRVMLVGHVVDVLRQAGRCTYFFADGTGPPIQIRRWYYTWADVMDDT